MRTWAAGIAAGLTVALVAGCRTPPPPDVDARFPKVTYVKRELDLPAIQAIPDTGKQPITDAFRAQWAPWTAWLVTAEQTPWSRSETIGRQVHYYRGTERGKVTADWDQDGHLDAVVYYQAGQPHVSLHDMNDDGSVDVRQFYRAGKVACVEASRRQNGTFDVWW